MAEFHDQVTKNTTQISLAKMTHPLEKWELTNENIYIIIMTEMIESEICRVLKFILIITIIPTFLFYCAINNVGKGVEVTEIGDIRAYAHGTTSIPTPSITQRHISKDIRKFFEEYYESKGATIIFTTDDDDNKDFIVKSLRGEVIKESKFWEKLQISVTLSQRKRHTLLKLIIAGKYSAGFKPPGVKGYKDMGDGYSTQLKNYVGEILTKLKGQLTK